MQTLYDLVSRILDARDGFNDPIAERRALRSAIWGADQVTQKHAWLDFHTESVRTMNAPVNRTASISVTGVVTVVNGVLPVWANEASVVIGDRSHVVSSVTSTTVATLENYSAIELVSWPIKIVHDRTFLSDDVRQVYSVRKESSDLELIFLSPAVFNSHQTHYNAVPGDPRVVTTARLPQIGNRRTELRLSPAPSHAMAIRVSYYRVARKATVLHDCGSVSIAADGLAVTISKPMKATEFNDLVLVLSGNTQKPDADIGFSVVDANPSLADLTVKQSNSPTTLTLMDAYQQLSNRGGVLTQRLDLPPHACEAAAMYAEAKYLQIGTGSYGDFFQTIQMADAELRTAMEQESILMRGDQSGSRTAIYTQPERLVTDLP